MTRTSTRIGLGLLVLGILGSFVVGTITLDETAVEPPQLPLLEEGVAALSDYVDREALDNFSEYPGGTQLTFVRLSDGQHHGSATERFPRPALSLAKLYIADYVLLTGDKEDHDSAVEMIEASDDVVADQLMEKYPEAIDDTARRYELWSTFAGETWGTSQTSTYDVVKFLRLKLQHDPDSDLLDAMHYSHEFAYDGYQQNFGTSTLPGARGTKWGWSDDRELHSSVSFGDDFVVAAAVQGSADDLTALVKRHVEPVLAR
ncbi:hypothetical protein [Corynebacterium kalinowskii]|uniref:hypothetical protein n=1 Tax=Corynebacterium kalinowskii TaxID=2675216 RepID=UPI0012E26426|nr:hypothetical protein [Corynebacterium kalinowskii]